MKQKVRTLLSGQIPVAIIFALLGICLIFVPAATFNVISKVLFGVALILSGAYHILSYAMPGKGNSASALDLYPGVISLVLGIFLFTNPQLVRVLLPWVLGAFLVADCIWLIKDVFKMRKYQIAMWEILVVVAILFTILGVILAFNPFSQVRSMLTFAGWLFLLKAITDVVLHLQVRKKVERYEQAEAAKPKAPESFAVSNVEPQRPAAPSRMQEWTQKQKEKRAQRAAAREEARLRQEAERAERIRRAQEAAQEEAAAAAAAQAAAAASAQVNAANEPVDGFYTRAAGETEEPEPDDIIEDVDFTETDADGEEAEDAEDVDVDGEVYDGDAGEAE